MKIISKFKDYYDSAMIMHDENVVLKRKTERLTELPGITLPLKGTTIVHTRLDLDKAGYTSEDIGISVLYFCGKAYPIFTKVVRQSTFEKGKGYTSDSEEISCFDSLENMMKYIEENKRKPNYLFLSMKENDWDTMIEKIQNTQVPIDLFIKMGTPYFFVEEKMAIKFPVLKEFTKSFKMDAFTAFQEIDMFLSGVMGQPEKEIVTISDKDKRDSKGFDNFSFKKRKE